MKVINGYLCHSRRKNDKMRNWFLIKSYHNLGYMNLTLPKEYIGKRIRLKIEEVNDEVVRL